MTSTPADTPPAPDTATAGDTTNCPESEQTGALAVHQSRPRLTGIERDERTALIFQRLRAGTPYREIAKETDLSIATIAKHAADLADIETNGTAKLMALKSLEMLSHWEEAAVNGAKSGKHSPARDWLIHAGALKPVASEDPTGAKVAIIIGMPGAPVTMPDLQVIAGQTVTDDADE